MTTNEIHIRIDQATRRWLKRRINESLRSINQEINYILQKERDRETLKVETDTR